MDRKFVLSKDDIPITAALTSPNEAACAAVYSSWFPGEDFTPENLKKVPMKAIREAMTSVIVDEIDFFLREIYTIIKFPVGEELTWRNFPQPGKEMFKALFKHIRYLMSKLEISKAEVKKQLVGVLRVYATEESISEIIDFFFKRGLPEFPTKIFQDMYNNADKSKPKPVSSIPEEFIAPSSFPSPRWEASDFRVTEDLRRAAEMSIDEIKDSLKKKMATGS